VLRSKTSLDSGTEKVLLIKLQKIVSAGAAATRYLELLQQDDAARAAAVVTGPAAPHPPRPTPPLLLLPTQHTPMPGETPAASSLLDPGGHSEGA
jgi:hypothetical protein